MVNIAICGSRQFPRLSLVTRLVQSLPEGTIVHTGGAIGVDFEASRAAIARGLQVVWHLAQIMPRGDIIPAGYLPYSSAEFRRLHPHAISIHVYNVTLPRRNYYIIKSVQFAHLFFVDQSLSGGTKYSLQFCRQLGVPYELHFPARTSQVVRA